MTHESLNYRPAARAVYVRSMQSLNTHAAPSARARGACARARIAQARVHARMLAVGVPIRNRGLSI